jgi:hypothetical protein
MGYKLPRGTRECQQANMKITKIRTSWDTNYHNGSWDENEPARSSPASRDNNGDADDDELGDKGEEGGSLGENDPRKLYLIQDIKTPILL